MASDKDRPQGGAPEDGPPEPRSVTILAETADDWDHAVEEWDLNLQIGMDEGEGAAPRAPSGPAYGQSSGELEQLPEPPPSSGALPAYQARTSGPPTLIADPSRVMAGDLGGASDEDVAEIEAGLPPPPPSTSTPPPSARSPRPSAAPVAVRNETSGPPPLPPPPPPSSASPPRPAPDDAAPAEEIDEVAQLPPLRLQPIEELGPEVAMGLAPPPPLPVDEEFYDTIDIEKPERSLPPMARPPGVAAGVAPVSAWDGGVISDPSGSMRGSLTSWPSGELRFTDPPSVPPVRRAPEREEPPAPQQPELPSMILIEAELPPGADGEPDAATQSAVTPLVEARAAVPTEATHSAVTPLVEARDPAAPTEAPADADRTPVPRGEDSEAEISVIEFEQEAAPQAEAAQAPTAQAPEPRAAVPQSATLAVAHSPAAMQGAAASEEPSPAAGASPAAAPSPAAARDVAPAAAAGAAPLSSVTPPAPSASTPLFGLAARRLSLPDLAELPTPPRPTQGLPPIGPEERRQLMALLTEEADARAAAAPKSAAALGAFAARQAELLGEAGDAQERYRGALELDPAYRPALSGLRRLLSQPGPSALPDEAVALVEREAERAPAGDRAALALHRGELLLLVGQPAQARQALRRELAASAGDAPFAVAALAGLRDAALQEGATPASEDLGAAQRELWTLPAIGAHPALRAALRVERARLDEAAGRDGAAAEGYGAALSDLEPGPSGLQAALGLLRVARRLLAAKAAGVDATALLRRAHAALAAALPTSPLRHAVLRRAALLESGEARRALLRAASEAGDRAALSDLGLDLAEAGLFAEAAECYAGIAERSTDPARRAEALGRAGEAFERAGQLDEARGALQEALAAAAAAGVAHDAALARALERVDRASGRPADLLQLARREAARPSAFAAPARLAAARLLLAGVADDAAPLAAPAGADAAGAEARAIDELRAALTQRPDFPPAALLLRQLLSTAGRHEEAAAALRAAAGAARAGEAPGDRAGRLFLLEDAARLLGRAGRGGEGALLLGPELSRLGDGPEAEAQARALRWQIERLLSGRVELVPETEPEQAALLADVLAAEATEAQGSGPRQDRPRAADLWYRRGLLLTTAHPQVAQEGGPVEESLGRALQLEPAHGPALTALGQRALSAFASSGQTPIAPALDTRLSGSRLVELLLQQHRERLLAATGRPEAAVLLLRLGAHQEHEARDPSGALLTLNLLRSVAPAHPGASDMEEGLLHLSRRAGDPKKTLTLLEDELGREQDEDLRFALLIQIGELYESMGQGSLAAERFEQALELRRGHPVARSALWRVYQGAGHFAKLRHLAEAELREAVDFAGRVAACERLAALASLDPEQARDAKNAIAAYQELLTVDANHHLAMRVLERHFIAERNWADLIHLYEQMGLTATDTAFAVHIHLERAHLRQKLAWQSPGAEPPEQLVNELENDFRLALYRDRHSRPALRHILAAALRTQDLNQVADLSTRLAEVCDQSGSGRGEAGDGRAAAVFLTRAAECYAALQQPAELVVQTFRDALGRNPRHLPAMRGLLHFALLQGLPAEATDAAELCAEAMHDPVQRYQYYLLAGALGQEQIGDLPRALTAFREALRIDPTRPEAFERMRQILGGEAGAPADPQALAELLAEQLRLENNPARQVALRLDLAQLLRDELQNRARAKIELRQALAYAPQSAPVLEMLAALHYDDGDWVEAVDALVRLARIEQRPDELAEIFLRLGQIYAEHLPDARRAVAAYGKALELLPDHVPALSQLAALHLQQGRPDAAVPLLERLSQLVTDHEQRVAYLHRAARLLETAGEIPRAQQLFQRAVDLDPMYLPSVGALASFFDRQSDVQSMRVHLDRAAGRLRLQLRQSPLQPEPYLALTQIFQWRRSTDLAAQAAAAAAVLGATLPPEAQALVERERRAEGYPGAALRDPQLDELLFPASIPPGFRNLFLLLQEPLGKLFRTDWKRVEALGVSKRERLPRSGHPVRDLANRLAADLGIAEGELDIYVTAAQGRDAQGRPTPHCTVLATEPVSLVLSQSLVSGAPEAELRFVLGRLLKLVQTRMVLPLQLSPDELGLLLGGLVRQFVKDYVPIGLPDKRVEAEAQRLHRLIPRKLESQLLPFALECSSASLDAAEIIAALWPCAGHAGLLIAGSVSAAASSLRRMGPSGEAQLGELLQFAVSREFGELRSLVGTGVDLR